MVVDGISFRLMQVVDSCKSPFLSHCGRPDNLKSITRRGQPCCYRIKLDVGLVAINDAFILEGASYSSSISGKTYCIHLSELIHVRFHFSIITWVSRADL